MASIYQEKNRVVFPRWRDFKSTSQSGDIRPFAKPPVKIFTKADIDDKINIWNSEQDISSATELLNSAFNLGLKEFTKDPAEFILKSKQNIPDGLGKIINSVLGISEAEKAPLQNFNKNTVNKYFHVQIADHRKKITNYPYNAIMWVELGRLHAIVNNLEKAERALLIALHLAPENRYVMRSLARFYVHSKSPEKALYYLNRSNITKHDPWLLSTHISVTKLVKGKSSPFIKNGFQLLEASEFSPFDKNELASSLGTVELFNGEFKNARKLFKKSLLNPNDNSVAQASWASHHITGITIEQKSIDLPCAYEARALDFFHKENYDEALAEGIKWLLDEPFASRPARFSSHIANTFATDYTLATELSRFALQNSPNNFDLVNNLAYSLCLENKPIEAELEFSKLNLTTLTEREKIIYTATRGLMMYRKGNAEAGKPMYKEAISKAKELGDDYLYRLAMVNFVREETTATPNIIQEIEPMVKILKDTSKEKQIQVELARIENALLGIKREGNFTFI